MNLLKANFICPRCKNPKYIVSLSGVSDDFQYKCTNCNSYFTFDDFTSSTSTKKDLVEVVRCKDCVHGKHYNNEMYGCEKLPELHGPDWFCADGERAE